MMKYADQSKISKMLSVKRLMKLTHKMCSDKRCLDSNVLQSVIELGLEIAREGREGRNVGTLFIIGDAQHVLELSSELILDPLYGHPDELKRHDDPDCRETIKELAQLDGAFIVSDDGVFLSAARYINADSEGIELPLGLGSRHVAAASITRDTESVAVVVSESAVVRIVDKGEIKTEIIPELYLLQRANSYLD